MSNAGSEQQMVPPPSLFSHIGPLIPAHATAFRYAAAIGVVFVVLAIRAALSPLLGVQAPLLPFLLGVLLAAYLGGRGPALLATGLLPVFATIWLTGWPHDAPPWQWVLHVLFFLLIGGLTSFIVEALQNAVRHADENARRAQAAADALRDTDRRKDEFLAMLAHELRNPLTPVRNVAHILSRAPDAATIRRASEMLERQATHLTRLVDDLLDVARITHRRVELQQEPVSLEEVAATAIETLQPTLDSRRQVLALTVENVSEEKDTYLLVTFFKRRAALPFTPPYQPDGLPWRIVAAADRVIFTVVDTTTGQTPDLMSWLDRTFGKAISSRTWKTVQRILAVMDRPPAAAGPRPRR